jgi:adhesin/invasin
LALPLEVLVTDDDDRPTADVEVSFAVTEGNGSLSELRIRSDNQGRARVQWTLGPDPGPNGVQAAATTSSGQPLAGSPLTLSALAVKPPPASLILRVAPSEAAQNDIPFERQPVIEVLDADLIPVPGVEVLASMTSGSGTLGGATTVTTDASGRATYTNLTVVGTTGPRILRFSVAEPSLEVTSGSIQIGAGAPSGVSANAPVAYEGIVNSPVAPAPSVTVKDRAGNTVPGVEVRFVPDRGASVSPEIASTNGDGIAQVTSWTLGTANGQYSLRAQVQSSNIDPVVFTASAKAGAAGHLAITLQPSSPAESGAPLTRQPVIQVVDQLGNPASQPDVVVTATVSSGPSGTLASATAVTGASGLATFSGLSLSGLVGDYTLSFSAPELAGVTSTPISLTAGPPTQLALVVAPLPTARSRVPLDQPPSIQLQDASGNPVVLAGVPLAASIATGTGTLGGQTAATTGSDGSATFTGLSIIGPPGPYTLRFTSTSPAFEIISGQVTLPNVADVVRLTSPSGPAVVGSRLSTPASWQFTDASNQPVADVAVELSVSPGGSVEPANPVSDASGIVQLQSWTLGTVAGQQFVDFPLPGGISTPAVFVNALPDVPTRLRQVSGDGQSAPINSTLPDLLLVQVTDQYNNGVGGVSVEWRTCDGRGELEQATDGNGLASAAQSTGTVAGNFCVRASSTGLDGSPVEFHFTVTSGSGSIQELPGGELERAPPPPEKPGSSPR